MNRKKTAALYDDYATEWRGKQPKVAGKEATLRLKCCARLKRKSAVKGHASVYVDVNDDYLWDESNFVEHESHEYHECTHRYAGVGLPDEDSQRLYDDDNDDYATAWRLKQPKVAGKEATLR